MKYPIVIKESYPSRDAVSNNLVKSVGEPLPPVITPEVPVPEEDTSIRPLPDNSVPPPSGSCQSPINILELPSVLHGFGANYKVVLDGYDINSNHINDLRNSGQWDMPIFSDGLHDVCYIDWSCGSNAGIQLTTRGDNNNIPTYPHQTSRHLVNFIPKPEQELDYIRDAEQSLRELNPNAVITTNDKDNSFSVCMCPLHAAGPAIYRYDDTYSGSHWSDTDVDRFNKVKLQVAGDVLDYSVSMYGETQNVGNLIGKTLTFGSFILTFTYRVTYIEVELTYDGLITPELNESYYIVRLTPNGTESSWADSYNRDEEAHITIYEDGVLDLSLDVQELKGVLPETEAPAVYRYTVTTDFKTTPLMTQLNQSIEDTQLRAKQAWLEWISDKNIPYPENTHKPRTITQVSVYKGGISNEDFILANYTKEFKQYKDRNGEWRTTPIMTLIGDGSRLYLMKSEAELKSANQYLYDYVSTDITLEYWMGTVGYLWVNSAITSTFYNFSPEVSSGVLTEYSFESDSDSLKYGEEVTRKFINTGIRVRSETSVIPGSASSPTVGVVFGNMVPYGTLTRGEKI